MAHEKLQRKMKDELLKVFDGDLSEGTHNALHTNLTPDQLEEVAKRCSSRVIDMLSDGAMAYLLNYVK